MRSEKSGRGSDLIAFLTALTAAAAAGVLLLTLAWTIPSAYIASQVEKSAALIREEGTYPELSGIWTGRLDNWTDALMLLEASHPAEESALQAAMTCSFGMIGEKNPAETLADHALHRIPFTGAYPYYRYWHGYLIFLRPLLLLLDLEGIRVLNGVLQTLLFLLVCAMLWKKGRALYTLPWVLAYGMLVPPALHRCLQFSSCCMVFMLATLAILHMKKDSLTSRARDVFLYAGIATAFLDLFSYPVVTMGVPAAILLLAAETDSVKDRFSLLARCFAAWGIGYGGMWAAKWIAGSLLTGSNIFADAWDAFLLRTSLLSPDGTVRYGLGFCITLNYETFGRNPFLLPSILLAGCLAVRIGKARRHSLKQIVWRMAPFLVTGCLPAAWYVFAVNHSCVHYWFTHKACVISLLAVLCGLADLARDGKNTAAADGDVFSQNRE